MGQENTVESMLAGAEGLTGEVKLGTPKEPVKPVADGNKPSTKPVDNVAASVVAPIVNENKPAANPAVTVKTAFGTQTYGGTPLADINLTSFADVQAFAKDFLGEEIKEVKDFVPLFTKLKQATEAAAQTAELKQLVDGYTATINNLPKDVSLILNAAIQGNDYKPIIQKLQQKTVIEYEKPFESQDTVKMVNYYTGRQYTKETFDALDEVSRDALSDSVKLKYETDRNEILNFEDNTRKATEQSQKKFKDSVESSISAMLSGNPQMGKAEVDRVRQIMLYGIGDRLFTKDKVYVPDAAEKIAMMEFGKEAIVTQARTIGDLVRKITNESESKVTEKLLLKSDKPPIGGGPVNPNLIASIVQRETEFLRK